MSVGEYSKENPSVKYQHAPITNRFLFVKTILIEKEKI